MEDLLDNLDVFSWLLELDSCFSFLLKDTVLFLRLSILDFFLPAYFGGLSSVFQMGATELSKHFRVMGCPFLCIPSCRISHQTA